MKNRPADAARQLKNKQKLKKNPSWQCLSHSTAQKMTPPQEEHCAAENRENSAGENEENSDCQRALPD